jgi:hypothetical protein
LCHGASQFRVRFGNIHRVLVTLNGLFGGPLGGLGGSLVEITCPT